MEKPKIKNLATVFIILALLAVFSLPVFAADEDDSVTIQDDIPDVAASEDIIMSFYEQNKDMAASLAIAMIDNGDTEFYYLGDISTELDYVFDWGSCTKVITWVCVMQLVEQGKIDLNTDIRTYLPEGFLTRLKYDIPVNMLNLMNHNAGFQEMSADLFEEDRSKIPALDVALKQNQPPQIHKPGEVVAYSNFGVALAGYIVQRVSGQDYGDYVKTHIFAPLGMEHTSIKPDHSDNQWVEDRWVREKCYWISRDGEKFQLGTGKYAEFNPLVYGIYAPAGSATGTIGDFAMFAEALIPYEDNKCPLFEKGSTLAEMYKPTLYYAEGTPRIAHGMWTEQLGNGLFGHGGNSDGFSSKILIDPVAKKAYAVMTNVVGEMTFNYKLPPLIFGKYDWGNKDFTAGGDISGRYNSMRGYTAHGFLKITRFLDSITVEKAEQDNVYYLYGDHELAFIQISDRVYAIDYDDMITYYFVSDDGVLQCRWEDWQRKSAVGYRAEWVSYNLFFLSFFFAAAVLLTKGTIFILKKVRRDEIIKEPKERYHLLSLGGTAVVILLLFISVNLDISDSVIAVFGVAGTICAAVTFVFGILQVKNNKALLHVRTLRAATLLTSAIVLANVLFWEFFNFWSV